MECPKCGNKLHKSFDIDAPNDGVVYYCKKCDKWFIPEDITNILLEEESNETD